MVVLKKWWIPIVIIVLISSIIIGAVIFFLTKKNRLEPIPVGVLFSLTGSLSVTEKPLVDATLMAIDEINKKGGVLGRQIKPIVVDGKSDAHIFKKAAVELIEKHQVVAIFGVYLSSIRKKLKKIVERYHVLLLYPANSEGLEESPNVVYMGTVPNQVVLPAIWWFFNNIGKKFFLVGSNNIFSETMHEMVKLRVTDLGGTIVGEEQIEREDQIELIVQKIVKSKPKVIINSLDPDMFVPFFKRLRAAGILPEKIPTVSLNLGEAALKNLDLSLMVGDFSVKAYFQTIYREENKKFIERFHTYYGQSRVVDSDMVSAYANVYIWKQACEEAGSVDFLKVQEHLKRQAFNAPGYILYLDSVTQHAWKIAYISKIQSDGQFGIVWSLDKQVKPLVCPPYKNKEYWDHFLTKTVKEAGSHE